MSRRRQLARRAVVDGTMVMLGGTLLAGVLTYIWQALGTRSLGEVAFAPVASVWTIMFLVVTILLAPVEQFAIRTVATGPGGRAHLAHALPRIAIPAAGALAVILTAAYLLREPLFGGEAGYVFICGAIVLSFGQLALVRGVLAGQGDFAAYGHITLLDSVVRLLVGVPLLLGEVSALAFAWTIPLGPLAALFWVRHTPRRSRHDRPEAPPAMGVERFIAHTVGGTMAAQVVLAGGPLAVALLGAQEAAVTTLFVTQTAFRAAFMVATPGASRVLPALTRIASRRDFDRLRRLARWLLLVTPALAAAAGLASAVVTPPIIAVFFGSGVRPSAFVAGATAAGTVVAIGSLALTQILVAGVETRRIALVWWIALGAGATLVALLGGTPTDRVVTGFVTAECIALLGLAAAASIGFAHRSRELRPVDPVAVGTYAVRGASAASGTASDG